METIRDSSQPRLSPSGLWCLSSLSSDVVELFASHNAFWISTRCACLRLSFSKFYSPSSSLSTIKTSNKLPSRDGIACGPGVKYLNWTVKRSIKSNEQSNAVEAQLSSITESKYQIHAAQQTRKFAISWHPITLDVNHKSSMWLKTQPRGSLTCPSPWLSLSWSVSSLAAA